MEFWGVEVKSGASLSVDPGKEYIVHISLMALGKKEKDENELVKMYVKVGEQKLLIGTLSHEKFPQLSTEIVLEKAFELSHSRKNGSVFFTGYKVEAYKTEDEEEPEPADPVVVRSDARQVNFQLPNEGAKPEQGDEDSSEDDSDDDTSSEEESGDEKEKKVTAEAESDDDDDDDDDSSDDEDGDSSDEETPKKAVEESKKRPTEATTSKSSTSNKKAKFVTPQKTESKKPHVHVATPHPSKGGKNSGSNGESSKQQQTPKSAAAFGCGSCNRSFTSEMGLQSHTKAKHSAAA